MKLPSPYNNEYKCTPIITACNELTLSKLIKGSQCYFPQGQTRCPQILCLRHFDLSERDHDHLPDHLQHQVRSPILDSASSTTISSHPRDS